MNFKEAKKVLSAIANGRYNKIVYGITTYGSGRVEQECSVYIDGFDHVSTASTWELALGEMDAKVNKQKVDVESIDEIDINMPPTSKD